MYSDERNRCSHRLGFPIRKSPDHRLIASSRGLSQLSTSFIASLRQGIHTHALSSLTIKSISNTKFTAHNGLATGAAAWLTLSWTRLTLRLRFMVRPARACIRCQFLRCFPSGGDMCRKDHPPSGSLQILVVSIARQIFDCQRSDFFGTAVRRRRKSTSRGMITFGFFVLLLQEPLPLVTARKLWWAWIDSNYRPHPYQGCALAT